MYADEDMSLKDPAQYRECVAMGIALEEIYPNLHETLEVTNLRTYINQMLNQDLKVISEIYWNCYDWASKVLVPKDGLHRQHKKITKQMTKEGHDLSHYPEYTRRIHRVSSGETFLRHSRNHPQTSY
jgi:hypothetical protein